MRLGTRLGMFVVLAVAGVMASTPLGFGADQDHSEQIGGLRYVDEYDHTTVTIDVFVRGRNGNPVTGLERGQFRLFQDGSEVAISNFTAFTQGSFGQKSPDPMAALPGEAEDRDGSATDDEAQPIYIILFIDNQYLRYSDRNEVLRPLRSFCDQVLGGPVQIMVVSYQQSIEIVQPFTDDPRAVRDALRFLRMAEAAGDERDEEHQKVQREIRRAEKEKDRGRAVRGQTLSEVYTKIHTFAEEEEVLLEDTLSAIRDTATALTGINGRKHLIYVSNGLPLVVAKDLLHEFAGLDTRKTEATLAMPYNKRRSYDALAATVNARDVTIHTIDATGSSNPAARIGDSSSSRSASAIVIARRNRQEPLRLLAENTGGLAVMNIDDFEAGLDRIRADLLTYYSIGYEIDSSGSDTVHHIEVKLDNESEYETRYRPTFVERSMLSRVQDEVTAGLFFDVGDNPLGIEVTPGAQVRATESQWLQPLTVFLPVTSLAMTPDGDDYVGQVVLFVAMRDLEGSNTDVQRQIHDFRIPADEYEQRKDDRFTISLRLLLASGRHTIVVGLLDEKTHQTSYQKVQATSPD